MSDDIKLKLPKRRFFVRLDATPEQLPFGIILTDAFTVKHALNVLRLKAGDEVLVIDDSQQTAYLANVLPSDKKDCLSLSLIQRVETGTGKRLEITLAAGLIKEQHWEWLLQKATELGARKIIPLQSSFSDLQPRMMKAERWESIVKAAALQSEGLFIPEISQLLSLQSLPSVLPAHAIKLLLLERDEGIPSLLSFLKVNVLVPETAIVLAIGPEGGWHVDEVEMLKSEGFQPVSLGGRVLRAETAAIVALGIFQQAFSGAESYG
ncbi:MAG: RsmE family RNA methyltransferase [Vampirovibrionales bacterium]|nr:RsmE family RNA methyltransferase [Vampirovibrionales bacterium]